MTEWNPALDTLLADWTDQAKCFEWMHSESASMFRNRAQKIMISLTALSAISGAGNIMTSTAQIGPIQVGWIFGALSVAYGVIHVLNDNLGYNALAQAHSQYESQWGHLRRQLEAELILPYASRKNASSFIQMTQTAIDQISSEGSSAIPKSIREACSVQFDGITGFKLPDICGVSTHTAVYTALLSSS